MKKRTILSGLAQLLEVGKRNSSNDARTIQAIYDGAAFLGADCGSEEADEATTAAALVEWLGGIDELREADLSHSDVSDILRRELRARLGPGDIYCWVVDVFDDRVVYEENNGLTGETKLYGSSYLIEDDGSVVIGQPVEVRRTVRYVPSNLTPETRPFVESAPKPVTKREAGKDFTAKDYAIVGDASKPGSWKLRLAAAPGEAPDAATVGAAAKALAKLNLSEEDRAPVAQKLRAAWRKANPDGDVEDMPEAIREALDEIDSELVALREAAVGTDGDALIKLIGPGWGSTGYYPAEVLERDGAVAFPKGTKQYWDHPRKSDEVERPERSLRDLAAELTEDAHYEKGGPEGPGLYARSKVFKGYQEAVNELAPHIGTSIRALGKMRRGEAEGRTGNIVEKLVAGKSVDFVTQAGAGGAVVELFESARGGGFVVKAPKREESTVDEKEIQALREAGEANTKENARLREAMVNMSAERVLDDQLGRSSAINDLTRARLRESLRVNPPVKEGELDAAAYVTRIDEAIKAEVDYLAKITGSGQVRGMGSGAPLQEAADTQAIQTATSSLEESMKKLGLTPEGAKVAAGGRG